MAHVLQISHGSDYEMMHNKLGFHKVCARWVPKQLAEVHKQMLVDICQKHKDSQDPELEHYQERGTTINSVRYSEMLTERLKPAIRAKTENYCRKVCDCTTMPVHILLPTLLKRSENSSNGSSSV